MRLFLDLDGVMADFDAGFERAFGEPIKEFKSRYTSERDCDDAMWPMIHGQPTFFRDLPPCTGAIGFLLWLTWHGALPQPTILTACPKTNYESAARQKREWVREHLGEHLTVLPVQGGRNKPLFMHAPGDVLIDDYRRNVDAWTAEGGVGILHRNFRDTKLELQHLVNKARRGPELALLS